ncbi:hypothetical protein CONLIGDRAFT_719446 [Coniochaeta ligniaria NRRL 30616]|uniref:Uncharacterized protein n=1 Tax=Coniochaeta ligniaria NRRL 30616 TaxID=1408157 RepID=A0A1J7I6Y3_9PEZI|nr:hypothetical protein CONLIGDRAFT_719446 [Coniochaeta ligniaria NRRL 30616]
MSAPLPNNQTRSPPPRREATEGSPAAVPQPPLQPTTQQQPPPAIQDPDRNALAPAWQPDIDRRLFITMPPSPSRRSKHHLLTWDTLTSLPTHHLRHQPASTGPVVLGGPGVVLGSRVSQVVEIWSRRDISRSEISEVLELEAREHEALVAAGGAQPGKRKRSYSLGDVNQLGKRGRLGWQGG